MHVPYVAGLAPNTARAAISRQLARRNWQDREQAAARQLGDLFRQHGPRINAQGLYAPGDAR